MFDQFKYDQIKYNISLAKVWVEKGNINQPWVEKDNINQSWVEKGG